MKNIVKSVAVLFAVAVLFVACGKKNPVLGNTYTWSTILGDLNYSFPTEENYSASALGFTVESGTYTIEDGKVICTSGDGTTVFTISGENLVSAEGVILTKN